jgi:hypothetical protein
MIKHAECIVCTEKLFSFEARSDLIFDWKCNTRDIKVLCSAQMPTSKQ